jgi:hypothetical protein
MGHQNLLYRYARESKIVGITGIASLSIGSVFLLILDSARNTAELMGTNQTIYPDPGQIVVLYFAIFRHPAITITVMLFSPIVLYMIHLMLRVTDGGHN